jgi:hypothetical protein
LTESRYENGRSVTYWKLEPWCVHGGWTVRWARWVRDPFTGSDQEDRPSDDSTVYPTLDEAKAAVAFLVKYGKGRAVG